MMRRLGGLLVVAVIAALGCSGDRACERDLETLGADCPQTFAGMPAQLPACPDEFFSYRALVCGDLIALVISYLRTNGVTCYYDASSHEIVGARSFTDVPTTCGGTTTGVAGRTADSCTTEPLATKDCSSQP